jgi:PAS domain S-box-containing protein
MSISNQADQKSGTTADQVSELFDTVELAQAVESEEFKKFLDHIPIAIAVAKFVRSDHRICYANTAFETLIGRSSSEIGGSGWSVLANFVGENDPAANLAAAMQDSADEFLGTFRCGAVTVEAYTSLIENDDSTENYRIAALIDVSDRARAEREEFIRQLRDRDMLLREVQHRVKNNLQLVVALIRLEARDKTRNAAAILPALAGRIESLQLLYQALSPDASGDELDLGHYLSQIAAAVMNSYAVDGIRIDTKVDHAPVAINVALPVGLVVNELLTNSFKHAFGGRGHGVITLECLRPDDDEFRIVVADDGVGLPQGLTWPVEGKISALIVQTLRENTKADIRVESTPGGGVRSMISFRRKVPVRSPN